MINSDLHKAKILLIIPYGGVGGIERLALHFYNYYKSRAALVKTVKIIKLKSDIINFADDELFLENRDLMAMSSFDRMLFYLNAPVKLNRIINSNEITHSIALGDMANLFSSLTFTSEFKVASIHALKSVELSSKTYLNKIFRLAYKSSYIKFDKIVCISKAIKQDLITNCGFRFVNNMEVIYNPHDIERIRELAEEDISDPTENEIFKSDVILFLGRLSVQKSPWHLIKAFSRVVLVNKNVKLVFIGDGSFEVTRFLEKLIKLLNLQERVIFLGRKTNPYKYLSRSKVLALSSHYEGTPNVIVESIAVGTPIVTSFCTKGISELMTVDDKGIKTKTLNKVESGIISPNFYTGSLGIPNSGNSEISQNENLMADALIEIINNLEYKKNLLNNQNTLLAKFDLGNIAKSYLKQ